MNFGDMCRLTLRYLHQEATNHDFGVPGSDNANLVQCVNDGYREFCRVSKLCRKVEELTTDGSAGYDLSGYFDDSWIDDYEIIKCNLPDDEIGLEFVDYQRYLYLSKNSQSRVWGWSLWEEPAGHTNGLSRYIYFIDTPGTETIQVMGSVLPVAMENSSDKPMLPGGLVDDVCLGSAKMWSASKRGIFYDMGSDGEVMRNAQRILARESNVDSRKRSRLDKFRGVGAQDYKYQ